MGLTELLIFVVFCNTVSTETVLPPATALQCSSSYEQLKEEVADGDYEVYQVWYAENSPAVQPQADQMTAEYLAHVSQ